jgi:hypothetical protein
MDVNTIQLNTTNGAATIPNYTSFLAQPTFTKTGANTFTGVAQLVLTNPIVNTSGTTMTTLTHFAISGTGASGTGAVTTQIGLDIPLMSFATTNIGIRNASTTVHTPSAQAVTGATYTILPTRTLVTFTTVTGTTVMTSNPTIADGQSGQVITLLNTDGTTSDCITINDGTTGVQLTANTTLCPDDSVTLYYNGTDWIEIAVAAGVRP